LEEPNPVDEHLTSGNRGPGTCCRPVHRARVEAPDECDQLRIEVVKELTALVGDGDEVGLDPWANPGDDEIELGVCEHERCAEPADVPERTFATPGGRTRGGSGQR